MLSVGKLFPIRFFYVDTLLCLVQVVYSYTAVKRTLRALTGEHIYLNCNKHFIPKF